jgi:hypothetical protein
MNDGKNLKDENLLKGKILDLFCYWCLISYDVMKDYNETGVSFLAHIRLDLAECGRDLAESG